MPRHPAAPPRFFFAGQAVHLVLLVLLAGGALLLVKPSELADRRLFGIGGHLWLLLAMAVPILHQTYVWLAWRSELCYGTLTRRFGDGAFLYYRIVFFLLFWSRPATLILLAAADHDSLAIPPPARVVLCLVLAIPSAYTFYSVVRHFGMARAAGADHFDLRYRTMPLVRKGMFRYSGNAMYAYAFLAFWLIAVAWASWAALVVAAFSHAYIWVHYHATERPDMKLIYGNSAQSAKTS